MKTLSLFALLLSAIALASGIAQATPSPSRGQALRAAESSPLASPPAPAIGDAVPSSDELSSRDPERLVTEVELQYTPEEEDGSTEKSSPNLIGSSPLRVPTCLRKAGKLHTQRKWSISYDYDSYYNGMHCGLSLKAAMKDFKLCRPMTDWTCVSSGEEGKGGVTIEFHTPRTCDDKRIHEAVLKATGNRVDVWCKHHQ